MKYTIVRSDDYLAHHGVKGQKWGIRRYQNEDGSLTAEGQKQRSKISEWYNSGSGKLARQAGQKKGLSSYDTYKTKRMIKGGAIGWLIGGIPGAVVGSFVSHKRVTAGREFFENELKILDNA